MTSPTERARRPEVAELGQQAATERAVQALLRSMQRRHRPAPGAVSRRGEVCEVCGEMHPRKEEGNAGISQKGQRTVTNQELQQGKSNKGSEQITQSAKGTHKGPVKTTGSLK